MANAGPPRDESHQQSDEEKIKEARAQEEIALMQKKLQQLALLGKAPEEVHEPEGLLDSTETAEASQDEPDQQSDDTKSDEVGELKSGSGDEAIFKPRSLVAPLVMSPSPAPVPALSDREEDKERKTISEGTQTAFLEQIPKEQLVEITEPQLSEDEVERLANMVREATRGLQSELCYKTMELKMRADKYYALKSAYQKKAEESKLLRDNNAKLAVENGGLKSEMSRAIAANEGLRALVGQLQLQLQKAMEQRRSDSMSGETKTNASIASAYSNLSLLRAHRTPPQSDLSSPCHRPGPGSKDRAPAVTAAPAPAAYVPAAHVPTPAHVKRLVSYEKTGAASASASSTGSASNTAASTSSSAPRHNLPSAPSATSFPPVVTVRERKA